MIRVAAGQKLSIQQDDIKLTGHAFESRTFSLNICQFLFVYQVFSNNNNNNNNKGVYAEDPLRGYLPSIGRLVRKKNKKQM